MEDAASSGELPLLRHAKRPESSTGVPQGHRGSVSHPSSAGASGDRGLSASQPPRREPAARISRQRSLRCLAKPRQEAGEDGLDDGASVYFAIETRLELKDRLATVQTQLDGVLVRAKLAWMKCFSAPPSPRTKRPPARSSRGEGARDAMAWATELADGVEALVSDLAAAFDCVVSGDGSTSLDAFKALVQRVEQQVAALLTLTDRIAAAPPDCFRRLTLPASDGGSQGHEPSSKSSEPSRPRAAEDVAFACAPVAFDLPSMQQYGARVAPPYAAYLPPKPSGQRRRR